jgi:hypothetical protein
VPFVFALAWYVHVVNRAGDGPGLQWGRIPQNASNTAALTGAVYAVFVLVALLVLYFTRVRGHASGGTLVLSALGHFVAAFIVALVFAVALAEAFCLADERAFQREASARSDRAELYTRQRWWPVDGEVLVSEPAAPR